jgi:hypothetical protein
MNDQQAFVHVSTSEETRLFAELTNFDTAYKTLYSRIFYEKVSLLLLNLIRDR